MRVTRLAAIYGAVFLAALVGSSAASADQSADEAAIRANAAKYVDSYNRRDSKSMASMWSPEAIYSDDSTGETAIGRDAIAKQLDRAFAGAEDAKLKVVIDSIDFVSPNVAVEKGTSEVTYTKHPPEKSAYTAVHVKRDGKWMLDRVTDSEAEGKPEGPPPSNYEHLKELEWMIGAWVDEGRKTTIQTECEWTKNKNFMTRSFASVVDGQVSKSGMQIVGWDPIAKQIRSWVFDSDGGFSNGMWKHKGDKWIIQQTGTLPDGGKASATHIMKRIDNDSFTWQSIDRTVDGQVMPNVAEVLVVRKPAE
jgi:uncharacterized protein (TIGR02246 family)